MAQRRVPVGEDQRLEKPIYEKPSLSEKSDITPAVPGFVIFKLLAFTVAMVGGPLATYYLTLNNLYKGNATFAGATAAIMANVVLIAYVVVAMREDQGEDGQNVEQDKKAR